MLRTIPVLLVRRLCWACTLVVLLGTRSSVHASDLGDGLSKLQAGEPTQSALAIAALAGSGEPRALAVLEALQDGRLGFDASGAAHIELESGSVDALTGEPSTPATGLSRPKLSNQLRRALAPSLARLRLASGDAQVRLLAAEELAKRPDPELAETMRAALTKEDHGKVARRLRIALAYIDLQASESARKLQALATLQQDGDVSHKPDLEQLLALDSSGVPLQSDEQVRAAAKQALQAIERRVILISSVANVFYGLSLGSVLLLAALGLAITFGLMKVINMAHGELLMIGAYTTFVVQNLFLKYLPGALDWYLVAAVPAAFFVAALVGLVLERGVIRFLYGRPLETLLATWGISLFLIQTVRLVFGAQNVAVANPSWLSGGWEMMPTVVLPYSRLATVGFSFVVVAFVWFLLRRTRLGLYVRAVTQNREMAGSMGIATHHIDMWTFGLGSGVAGLGGVALSQLGNVGPELGQGYIVDSFMVVVLGGVGNLMGTILGATGLGLLNKFLEPVTGAVLGKILILVIVILFIQKRPQGLFALKGRAAEL